MKKRVLSILLAVTLIFSSVVAVMAETDYDGIKPVKVAETVLDKLNADASADIFDKELHTQQLAVLTAVNDAFDEKADAADWSAYIDAVYTNRKTDYIENYLKLLAVSEEEPAGEIATALASVDAEHNTEGLGLYESFGKLGDYRSEVAQIIDDNKAQLESFVLSDAKVKEYVLLPTKLVFAAVFSEKGAGVDGTDYLEYNYVNGWLGNDRAKKLLAVLFGEELVKELASNSTGTEGVVAVVKNYIGTAAGLQKVKGGMESIFADDKSAAADATYDFMGSVLSAAYEGKSVCEDIVMLFGDGESSGAFEIAMKLIDEDCSVINTWINLLLSEYVQVNLVSGALDTVDADGAEAVEIKDNASISFKAEGTEEYGISARDLPLRNSWFDVACYVDGEFSDKVIYYDGKISVSRNSKKGSKYDAYLVLYRSAISDDEANFIESYPIVVVNSGSSSPAGGSGSGGIGTNQFIVKYESNGGQDLMSDSYAKGTILGNLKSPEKPGYIFAGWYIDEELTQPAENVVVDKPITLYAKWVKAGSSVVSTVEIPSMLDGDTHFAYVVGYSGGKIRPMASITRAEVATILFRLLKDSVRSANITTENAFADVNEGDWYNKAVSTLTAMGIVKGRTETEFKPNDTITRAELATLIARFADFGSKTTTTFSDISGHWAADSIKEVASYGWIAGYEDATFRPDNRITRAETMTVINRVLKRVPENKADLLEGMNEWNDNRDTTVWYYLAVQEATNSHQHMIKENGYEKWTKLTEDRDWSQFE